MTYYIYVYYEIGAREEWQVEMEDIQKNRLLGLPRKAEDTAVGVSRGEGGSELRRKIISKRKNRARYVYTALVASTFNIRLLGSTKHCIPNGLVLLLLTYY